MQLAYPSQQCEEGRRLISASRHRTSQYPPFVRPETLRQSCTLRPVHPAPRDDLPLSLLPCRQFPTGPIRFPALWISTAHYRLVLFLFLDPLLVVVPCASPRQTRTLWATYTIVKNGKRFPFVCPRQRKTSDFSTSRLPFEESTQGGF